MIQSVLFLLVGLGILLFAGELLVRGASGLARIANIPALVVGLT
ncbi:MAG: sodium:calcium antiporter, partial [Parvularculaceae bacterium]|nr:sodium:calcium antiporter [Parvularculaceae bacterium]